MDGGEKKTWFYKKILAHLGRRFLWLVARGHQLSSQNHHPLVRAEASGLLLGGELPTEGRSTFSGWKPSSSLCCLSHLGQLAALSWLFTSMGDKCPQQSKAVAGRADGGVCCQAHDWTDHPKCLVSVVRA